MENDGFFKGLLRNPFRLLSTSPAHGCFWIPKPRSTGCDPHFLWCFLGRDSVTWDRTGLPVLRVLHSRRAAGSCSPSPAGREGQGNNPRACAGSRPQGTSEWGENTTRHPESKEDWQGQRGQARTFLQRPCRVFISFKMRRLGQVRNHPRSQGVAKDWTQSAWGDQTRTNDKGLEATGRVHPTSSLLHL